MHKGITRTAAWPLALQLRCAAPSLIAAQFSANFKNADIRDFISSVSKQIGKTILVHPSVQGSISVRSFDNFNEAEYYQFFLSVLDIYGYTAVTLDNGLLKVVRSAALKTAPGVLLECSQPAVGDESITRVVSLKNVPARDLAPLLRQMMEGSQQLTGDIPTLIQSSAAQAGLKVAVTPATPRHFTVALSAARSSAFFPWLDEMQRRGLQVSQLHFSAGSAPGSITIASLELYQVGQHD
ncbi:type II secretion system protein GspM [Enterobacter sp. ENT03]|uniref:type II secretion system protein GspM n=1 Tax=Enterobacter sp. ENT03 TaxID=2854780 RepID=UPI001C450425|nr:type II secretion system protein M [Enterobacter sp. ENT03]